MIDYSFCFVKIWYAPPNPNSMVLSSFLINCNITMPLIAFVVNQILHGII